jgi:hypothetical protein
MKVTSPDEIKYAWAAGILEGEGCFSIFHRKTASQNHKTLAIHCEMTDEDIIVRLYCVFGVGNVLTRENKTTRVDGRSRKKTWIWSVQNHAGIHHVCQHILPHMGKRRTSKIKELLEYVESKNSVGDTRCRTVDCVHGASVKPCESNQ